MFAPSFGRWYAGDVWSTGLTLRLAVGGAAALAGPSLWTAMNHDADPGGEYVLFLGLVAAAGAITAVGAAMDIHDTPEVVRDANRAHRAHHLTVAPTVIHAAGAARPGLVVAGSF